MAIPSNMKESATYKFRDNKVSFNEFIPPLPTPVLNADCPPHHSSSECRQKPVRKCFKSQFHAIFCDPTTKNRSRMSHIKIACRNRTHQNILIEIVRIQKNANRIRRLQIVYIRV